MINIHVLCGGWPWYTADIPPNDFYDCVFLFFACSDNEKPGSYFR
jgi:flavodoxin